MPEIICACGKVISPNVFNQIGPDRVCNEDFEKKLKEVREFLTSQKYGQKETRTQTLLK